MESLSKGKSIDRVSTLDFRGDEFLEAFLEALDVLGKDAKVAILSYLENEGNFDLIKIAHNPVLMFEALGRLLGEGHIVLKERTYRILHTRRHSAGLSAIKYFGSYPTSNPVVPK